MISYENQLDSDRSYNDNLSRQKRTNEQFDMDISFLKSEQMMMYTKLSLLEGNIDLSTNEAIIKCIEDLQDTVQDLHKRIRRLEKEKFELFD